MDIHCPCLKHWLSTTPFCFHYRANFKDLGMCQTAPWFSCSKGAGEGCILSRDTGDFVFNSITSLSFGHAYVCPVHAASVWEGSFPLCCLHSDMKAVLVEPSNSLCGKMEQLIPSVEKYKSWNQGSAWELTLNVKTYWGSQLFFGSLSLILEFLQPVTFCKAPLWCVACNCSTRK